jgi:hypothetical protein
MSNQGQTKGRQSTPEVKTNYCIRDSDRFLLGSIQSKEIAKTYGRPMRDTGTGFRVLAGKMIISRTKSISFNCGT